MKRILFVNQDMIPYVGETELSTMSKLVPQKIQEAGFEVRCFMPKWGNINERRGQLHEVIRLSGINISINDTDHPLIIKVASVPQTRMQAYFIDNEEFFSRKFQTNDEKGKPFKDNGERTAFFVRGVVETIKKLRWIPDVIVCQGWMAAVLPLIIKQGYKDEPAVSNSKIVTAIYNDTPGAALQKDFKNCLCYKDITLDYLKKYGKSIDGQEIAKMAIDHSDGIILASQDTNNEVIEYAKQNSKELLEFSNENFIASVKDFLENL